MITTAMVKVCNIDNCLKGNTGIRRLQKMHNNFLFNYTTNNCIVAYFQDKLCQHATQLCLYATFLCQHARYAI